MSAISSEPGDGRRVVVLPSQPFLRQRQLPSCSVAIISAYFSTSCSCAFSLQSSSSRCWSDFSVVGFSGTSRTSSSSLMTTSLPHPPTQPTRSLPTHDQPRFAHCTSLICSGLLIHLSTCRNVRSLSRNCPRSHGAKFGGLRSSFMAGIVDVTADFVTIMECRPSVISPRGVEAT